ncbi:sister chromatid cohesion 1 protein 2 [Daucus carota subsp. sativus]|uniref:sister chromatid cohesion 1 protein 2 n=1 Tax=Daucus carota subsp. sativus TaxID=79200 RepID=UPI0007EF2B29|nr:PREDICTED: sister chromatid cohesion 1 protein 2 [Daucus carota subsp. sativus]
MFYSQELLSKKGALGTIWAAAHSLKKLTKEDVFDSNISSFVDKILLDEVPAATYRILAYLLLGVVRIYSMKVEYLFCDCNNVLSEVRHFITSAKIDADIELMCAPYSSITVPERFELDAFDLEIIEDLNRDHHTKMQEEITLKDKDDGISSPSFQQSYMEEDTSNLGGFSAVHATCNDHYSMSNTTAEMVASTLHNIRNLDRSMDKFQNYRFSLEDCLPPMLFDEDEERADPSRKFHEDSQKDGVEMNPSNSPIMLGDGGIPEGNAELLDDKERADPSRKFHEDSQKDGVEMNPPNSPKTLGDGGRPEGNAESLDEEHANSANKEFSNFTGLQNEKIQIIPPRCPISIYIDTTPESKVPNSPGVRTPGLMAVGTPATKEGARVSQKRKSIYDAKEIDIANNVYKAGLDDPGESARVSRKQKCLYDANGIVIRNEVYKAGLDDPSELVKKRKKAALRDNANQISEKTFFQPLIPGVSINFRSLSLLSEKEQKSPEKKDTIITPTKTLSIGSLGSHETPAEISVTPSSHVTNSVSQCYNNTCGSTNSERLGSATSFASVDREFSAIGDLKFDGSSMSFATVDGELSPVEDPEYDESLTTQEEEINLCEGDDEQEKYHWSTRTRAVARYLHTEFVARKKRGEDEVVKLSQVVEGKSKKRNARMFYELLGLATQGFVDVKQDNPYDDISIMETSKCKQPFRADNMA